MEKISRILPPSPRLTAVDLKNSGVTRPGAPSFGRPVGTSALGTPRFDGMSRALDELKEFKTMREPTHAKDPKVEIVERISRDFFSTSPKAAETAKTHELAEQIVARFHDGDSDLDPMTGASRFRDEVNDLTGETESDPFSASADLGEDAPMVGSQLDVMA